MNNLTKEQTGVKVGTRCLRSQQYDLETLYKLCELTDRVRDICKTKRGANYISTLLNNKRAMLYFEEPSTRTYLSFETACHMLGIRCSDIRDINTSSKYKGESELDSFKTFSQYKDLIIIRSNSEGLVHEVSKHLDDEVRIINAGSKGDQHPTQSLLDFYTIYKHGIKNKKIALVGDLYRGRAVRSLALLLNKVEGIKLYLVAPKGYQMREDVLKELVIDYELTDSLDEVLSEVDVIYMTRVQNERVEERKKIGVDFDSSKYILNGDNIKKMKEDAMIMHPLPRNGEIATEVDNDPRAMYWEQTENGLWVRVALILMMFNAPDIKIHNGSILNKLKANIVG
ncbi:MAG: aspartate carbamoyltransferase [Bacilli bacterium]|nr:aspartate carbamoyltransferase [Bacilli bacterium]